MKLDSYMKDYERLFDENKRLRDLTNQLRDEKDSSISELARSKTYQHNRLNEVTDEANIKVAHLESLMLEMKERHKAYEERAYSVMINQEKITEKWKTEHRNSVQYFERAVKHLDVENRHLQEQVIELKGRVRSLQGGAESRGKSRDKK